MPRKNKRKWEREEQIRGMFQMVGKGEWTAYDVAKFLDVVPAKWIYELLDKLVVDGVLEVNVIPHRSNTTKKVYRLCKRPAAR